MPQTPQDSKLRFSLPRFRQNFRIRYLIRTVERGRGGGPRTPLNGLSTPRVGWLTRAHPLALGVQVQNKLNLSLNDGLVKAGEAERS